MLRVAFLTIMAFGGYGLQFVCLLLFFSLPSLSLSLSLSLLREREAESVFST